jgi:hypothetical protein
VNFDERMMQRLTNAEREIERLKVKESAGAWLDWTPTVTYYGGSTETDPTSESIETARYCRIGKLVHVNVVVSVTRGAGDQSRTVVTLPITGANALGVGTGHENICQASSTPRTVRMGSTGQITMYHTAMTQDGYVRMTITYEAA